MYHNIQPGVSHAKNLALAAYAAQWLHTINRATAEASALQCGERVREMPPSRVPWCMDAVDGSAIRRMTPAQEHDLA